MAYLTLLSFVSLLLPISIVGIHLFFSGLAYVTHRKIFLRWEILIFPPLKKIFRPNFFLSLFPSLPSCFLSPFVLRIRIFSFFQILFYKNEYSDSLDILHNSPPRFHFIFVILSLPEYFFFCVPGNEGSN